MKIYFIFFSILLFLNSCLPSFKWAHYDAADINTGADIVSDEENEIIELPELKDGNQ